MCFAVLCFAVLCIAALSAIHAQAVPYYSNILIGGIAVKIGVKTGNPRVLIFAHKCCVEQRWDAHLGTAPGPTHVQAVPCDP